MLRAMACLLLAQGSCSPCPTGRDLVDLVNSPHGCACGGLRHTESTETTDYSALLRSRFFYVTQIAQIARIFLLALLAGADAD